MTFTDGYWLMRKGYELNYTAQAYDVESDAESLTVYAPIQKSTHAAMPQTCRCRWCAIHFHGKL